MRLSRRPTVYDVAQRAGVSIATVSFAFRQPHRVRSATLRTVLAAAQELGYLPSASARGLATGRTGVVGLYAFDYLVDDATAERGAPADDLVRGTDQDRDVEASSGEHRDGRRFPLYVDEVQHGVELECRRRGYALMVGGARTGGSTPTIVDVAGRVDGLIAFAGSLPSQTVAAVARRIPVVALGSDLQAPGVGLVRVDDAGGMRAMVEHLLGAHARRRPVFVGELQTVEIADRYRGFVEALAAAGIPAPPPLPSRPGLDPTTVRAVTSRLAAGPVPDAFVCATDQEALVTLEVLAGAGLPVPQAAVVTGFDDVLAAQLARPALTTVRQPMQQLGRAAVASLAALMAGQDAGTGPQVLPVELVLRGSCGCLPPSIPPG